MSRIEQIGDATQTHAVAIYALCEFPNWEPRYVGKTIQYLHDRHKAHIRDAKRGRTLPVHYWLRKRIAAGDMLAIKLIEYVRPGEDWAAHERHWIAKYRANGHALLNLTTGGEGVSGHRFTPEHSAKIAAALRTGATFQCKTCTAAFWRKRNEIKKGECRFCSRACYAASLKGKSRPMPDGATERGIASARTLKLARAACKHGHLFTPENTRLNRRGARVCRACQHAAQIRCRGRSYV